MLKISRLQETPVDRLTEIWAARYVPDLSTLSLSEEQLSLAELLEAASPKGRKETVTKLQRILDIHCKCAGIQTSVLFSYIPNVVNLTESQGIARAAGQVYQAILDIHRQQSPTNTFLASLPKATTIDMSSAMPGLDPGIVEQLATALELPLQHFRERHLSSSDRRALGFMSTQFHLSAKLVLNRLTLAEQVLLSPYFRFIEEQVCIPWQRICTAAANHADDSPAFVLVEQMLPKSRKIASSVFRKAIQIFPNYRSRRGKLSEPGVKASSVRDIEMFQAYLWLCVLEGRMAAVEEELYPLSAMVYPSVNVTWELVEQMLRLLVDEIVMQVSPSQVSLVEPYLSAMQEIFVSPQIDTEW
jgi:hypothetical protein